MSYCIVTAVKYDKTEVKTLINLDYMVEISEYNDSDNDEILTIIRLCQDCLERLINCKESIDQIIESSFELQ